MQSDKITSGQLQIDNSTSSYEVYGSTNSNSQAAQSQLVAADDTLSAALPAQHASAAYTSLTSQAEPDLAANQHHSATSSSQRATAVEEVPEALPGSATDIAAAGINVAPPLPQQLPMPPHSTDR